MTRPTQPVPALESLAPGGSPNPVDSQDRERNLRARVGAALAGLFFVIWSYLATICWLAQPSLLSIYYPVLGSSRQRGDAVAVARWLKTEYRERTLNLSLTGGHFTPKELRHYSSVRPVLHWATVLLIATSTAGLLAWAGLRPDSRQLRGTEQWANGVALSLLLVAMFLAWFDWNRLFAWIHYPLFGERSWRFARHAYSLELFPTKFWKLCGGATLLSPLLYVALLHAVRRVGLGSRARRALTSLRPGK